MLFKHLLALASLQLGVSALCSSNQVRLFEDGGDCEPVPCEPVPCDPDYEPDPCPAALVLACRGTLEKRGYGALEYVVGNITEKVKGSDAVAMKYPAAGISIKDPDVDPPEYKYNITEYVESELEGHAYMLYTLHKVAGRCPKTLFALLGYSQGAHVVGDVLCGKQKYFRNPLEAQIAERVVAIMQYGDPSNVKDLAWHVGTSTRDGLFPRENWTACEDYGDRWVSYCTAKDPFCAPQFLGIGNNVTVHLHYADPEVYGNAAIKFVSDKLNAALKKQAAQMELK